MIDIGYFGRAHENGHSVKNSKVHAIYKGRVLCGYKPHETMKFQWCSTDVMFSYIECPICKKKADKIWDILNPTIKSGGQSFLELAKRGMI